MAAQRSRHACLTAQKLTVIIPVPDPRKIDRPKCIIDGVPQMQ
jgi:hypothetical protein